MDGNLLGLNESIYSRYCGGMVRKLLLSALCFVGARHCISRRSCSKTLHY